MKVALLSESPADETALRLLVEGVLGAPPHFVSAGLRARGWPSVAQILPAVLRHLHFNTDAHALVVVVDSDDSVVHTLEHDRPGYFHPQCRMCQLRAVFRQTIRHLPARQGREHVLRGVGIAVPAVEGWYLCGRDASVSEQAWAEGLAQGRPPYTRAELKLRVYGTSRPSLPHETLCAVHEIQRQMRDLQRLEADFPSFAALATDLRHWSH